MPDKEGNPTPDDHFGYMKTKIAWYGERITELKAMANGFTIAQKSEKLVALMEFINLELALDQTFIANMMMSGVSGLLQKKLEIFSALLSDISYRLKFYVDTHIRGM